MTMKYLLVGGGNLGSRHLQGLIGLEVPAQIDVLDPNIASLDLCWQRVEEARQDTTPDHQIRYLTNSEDLDNDYDLGINATTSAYRVSSLRPTAHRARYWILEKVLTQNEAQLDEVLELIAGCEGAWSNLMMRELVWCQDFQRQISAETIQSYHVEGKNWSMACNIIHHLDFVSWISSAQLKHINTEGLSPTWYPSKRAGNFEILGQLNANFEKDIFASFTSYDDGNDRLSTITTEQNVWILDEIKAQIRKQDKVIFAGAFDRQSQLTKDLAKRIIKSGKCNLPKMGWAAETHRIFIRSMLNHWRHTIDEHAEYVPIT